MDETIEGTMEQTQKNSLEQTQNNPRIVGSEGDGRVENIVLPANSPLTDDRNEDGEFVPYCDDETLIPQIGMEFDTTNEGKKFYERYAVAVGFSVRSSSQTEDKVKGTKWKSFVCTREGWTAGNKCLFEEVEAVKSDSPEECDGQGGGSGDEPKTPKKKKIKRRRTSNIRQGCCARLTLRSTPDGKFKVVSFHIGHSHPLTTPSRRHLERSSRQVYKVHTNFMNSLARTNVGATKAYSAFKESVGSYEAVGCTLQDFRNYRTCLKNILVDLDAEMFIEIFRRNKDKDPGFYFSYEVDNDKKLKSVFWCDSQSRRDYAVFGDLVSFDTKHQTNKYKMIFAAFTGMNHHRKLVSFGASLIRDEKGLSFVWLFEKFVEAMQGHHPDSITTDQDPAIKEGVNEIFTNSVHRFCIWHIMRKMPEKVGHTLNGCEEFLEDINLCVWASETPEEFENKWALIVDTYGLSQNAWFTEIYNKRDDWAHAYFTDKPLGGVMRTTSGSESENSMFGKLMCPSLTYVEFWARFEHAIDAQRNAILELDHATKTLIPKLATKSEIEKHARTVYTHCNFWLFQEQLVIGVNQCHAIEIVNTDHGRSYKICEKGKLKERRVVYNTTTHDVTCDCPHFTLEGIPCSHALFVIHHLDEMPPSLIVERWTMKGAKRRRFDVQQAVVDGCNKLTRKKRITNVAWQQLYTCMDLADGDESKLGLINEHADVLIKKLEDLSINKPSSSVASDFETYYGTQIPKEATILPPPPSTTKGKGRRIKTAVEAASQKKGSLRRCSGCDTVTTHDRRTCPVWNS